MKRRSNTRAHAAQLAQNQAATVRRRLLAQERWAKTKEDERSLAESLAQTISLAEARGEEVVRQGGRVQMADRDGLLSLLTSGGIDQSEFRAGLLYRQAFELLEAGPRSNLNRSIGGGGGDAYAERRAQAGRRLEAMEDLATTAQELWALKLCAGEGQTVRSFAGGGRAHGAAVGALRAILGQIAAAYGLKRDAA